MGRGRPYHYRPGSRTRGELRSGRMATTTEKQRRKMRRQRGRHVVGVARVVNAPAFADGHRAIRYALARRLPVPDDIAEASRFIRYLEDDPRFGIVAYANRDTPRLRRFRRRFQRLLRERYGWPDPEWVDRLNAEIEARWSAIDPGRRGLLATDTARYRAEVVDPMFRELRPSGARERTPGCAGQAPPPSAGGDTGTSGRAA